MKIKRRSVMAASGEVEFTNELDAIYDALKNLEFNTPDASMFVDIVRKPRYAVRVETEHTLEDGNTLADETFYIFKSDDGRIKAVFEDQNPRVFIDRDAVVTFIRDYWRDRGFDLTSGVAASTKSRASRAMAAKRPIKASAGSDPYKLIKEHKDSFIDGWASEYEGEPETSWDNIFNNVLEEFRTYCGDEASDFIIDEYNEGRYTEGDMMSAFEQFIMFLHIPAYDE